MTLKGDTLLHDQKRWDAILSEFWKSLSTNNIWPGLKSLTVDHNEVPSFIIPLENHPKLSKGKEKYEASLKAPRVHIVKDEDIPSSKATKSHVKLIIYIYTYRER